MKTRIISGAVLFAILLSSLLVGSWYLFGFCLAASLIGMYELYRAYNMEKTPLAFISYGAAIALYLTLIIGRGQALIVELFIYLLMIIAMLAYFVFTHPKVKNNELFVAIFAFFYVAFMLSFVFRLRSFPGGNYTVWLIFLGSWVNDTCAYFTGYFLGKRKMAPILSPKKTWEGAIGGIAGATALGLIYGIIIGASHSTSSGTAATIIMFTLAGALGSICGIIGDLAASAIKRNIGLKDYGRLIPGHGGILDRFDSVILTGPIVFMSVYLFTF